MLDYPYFKDSYKIIAVDISEEQTLDANPRKNKQISFTARLDRPGNTRIYVILQEVTEIKLDFSKETVKVL